MKNRFNEDKILKEISEYIDSTYGQHYSQENGLQVIDVMASMGHAPVVCQMTALKYIMRYGKKGGKNKADLMKAIHYLVMLMNFDFEENKDMTLKEYKEKVDQETINIHDDLSGRTSTIRGTTYTKNTGPDLPGIMPKPTIPSGVHGDITTQLAGCSSGQHKCCSNGKC